jgi:predicted Rossmann fold flavoprotein
MNKKISKPAVAIIGGGAAGFFTAVNAARLNPALQVTIFEKSKEVLSKVRVSGGGRCNVTHHCFDPEVLAGHYPRGSKMLRWSFEQFQASDTVEWFESRGVKLKAEKDGRMFPVTDNSESVISCLMEEARRYGVKVRTRTRIDRVEPLSEGGFRLHIHKEKPQTFGSVVVATGGYNRENAYEWLKELGHSVVPPVPSLFTFNFREKVFSDLAGISVEHAEVHIEETRFTEQGPVLITHWGLSGPAVLKLSAWAARDLHDREYRYRVRVNWLYPKTEQEARKALQTLRESNARKQITKQDRFPFPARLWERFVTLAGISPEKRWADLSNKEIHSLLQQLVHARYDIQGKTTYKEEFVTCGGIPLNEIDPDTLESKLVPGLWFVGEVLDIDGVTGGFNFQAAWTNGWLAAHAIAESL